MQNEIQVLHHHKVPQGLKGPMVGELVGLVQSLDPAYHVLHSNCQHLATHLHGWFLDHLALALLDSL